VHYLLLTKATQWEIDWERYRVKSPLVKYGFSQALFYGILGFIVAIYPLIYKICYNISTFQPKAGYIVHIIFSFYYFVSIVMLSLFSLEDEKDIKKNWIAIKDNPV